MKENNAKNRNDEFLYNRLVHLGDMMGDGLHHEPGGKWIEKEYKQTLVALGIIKRKKPNVVKINEFMNQRVASERCECGGELRQARSGSFVAKCVKCGSKYRPGRTKQ